MKKLLIALMLFLLPNLVCASTIYPFHSGGTLVCYINKYMLDEPDFDIEVMDEICREQAKINGFELGNSVGVVDEDSDTIFIQYEVRKIINAE